MVLCCNYLYVYICRFKIIEMAFINELKKYLTTKFIAGIVLGGIAGYAYYYFIGCSSGSCAITSNPFNSTIYGIVAGGILFFGKKKEESE